MLNFHIPKHQANKREGNDAVQQILRRVDFVAAFHSSTFKGEKTRLNAMIYQGIGRNTTIAHR